MRLIIAVVAVAALSPVSSFAQGAVPTGIQEYFILGYEQHVWDMMSKVEAGEGGGAFANAMNSLVTGVASADNQVIYYDHWEDGLEADIFNPVQASTLIVGDGNAANGDACDFNNDPCGADLLSQGDFVNFGSNQGILAGCTVPSASPLVFTELCSSVPLNPRCAVSGACTAAEVRFDGGDFIQTTGGPLSLVHSQDPLTQFIGGSTEVISKQAVKAARSYSVPIGEDLYPAFGCPNCVMEPFHYVDLNLVAFEDNTQVFVDSPGAGTVSFTLNRGEHWSSLGFIDDNPFDATLFLTINSGTKVSTTAAIAGMLFTGGDGTWATRHYTLLPDILHSTDYVITAPGDDPAVTGSTPNRPANLYIFNPDPSNPVTVTATDTVGTTNVVVPPNSVVDYNTGTGRFVPNGSTVRLTSDRNFWGVSGYDYNTNISDWGHSWLATKFLTENYTVSFAPGTLNPPVDMVNLSAVFIAATADNTRVQIDFDNDGVFDVIDLDGDGVPDPAPLANNTYVINSLASLRVFDPNDFDNTGTRIVANKPVAVSWGQDTDLTDFGDTALDTGFTVYPTDQLFLEPVLVLTKDVDVPVVSTSGGQVTYTISIQTFEFFPLSSMLAWDLLPPGVTGADYVPGSTLITYPDLTQGFNDPVASIDPGSGRDRLDWALSPDSMAESQTLTIRYSVNIPPAPGGTPRVLTNEAHTQGNLGSSVFSPFDSADVVQTDLVLTKSSADDGTPEPGEVLTYTMSIANNGVAAETNAIISDAIPADTTFLPGSITSSGPFAGAFSAAQNAVVWTAASFPVGGPHVLTFQVTINPGVPADTTITNGAHFESFQTPLFPSNEVENVTVGPQLIVSKSGPAIAHPNETLTFEIFVENVGAGAANNVLILDPFPTNATYVAGSMAWRFNVNPFVSVSDAADADAGTAFVDRLELAIVTLGAGEDLTFRFDVVVDPGTHGLFVNNQATVSSTEVLPTDTNLVQVPIVGDADITGHVFLDLDADGTQDFGEPDLPNVDVVVTDSQGNVQTVSTDANGDYSLTVEPGNATANVDETDLDFPNGATLTTANDPQVVAAVSGSTVAATAVGYDPRPFTFTKTSDAVDHEVIQGQTITYTLTVENTSGITQTGIVVGDPLPAGTSAVTGSTQLAIPGPPILRATEYCIGNATAPCTGTTAAAPGGAPTNAFNLVLDQVLAANYFVIIQGSDGNGGDGNGDRRGPDENYVSLWGDPSGTSALNLSGATDEITLTRNGNVNGWTGVVTVVECVSDCSGADGFQLRDVLRVSHTGSGSGTAAATIPNPSQTLLMGGFNGAGCDSTETDSRRHRGCWARFWNGPAANQISWSRDSNTGRNATSTVMAVEWGSNWTVQSVNVTGGNGGNGLNNDGEYNFTAISPVARANTWVWGTGTSDSEDMDAGSEGAVVTIGRGATVLPVESSVSVGTEGGGDLDFQVWALTHSNLRAGHIFEPDGNDTALTEDVTGFPAATDSKRRMAISYNGLGDNSDRDYPAAIFSARYVNDTTIRMERRFSDYEFPGWVQGIDFSLIIGPPVFAGGGDPPNLVVAGDGYSLLGGQAMTVTFQVVVDDPLAGGITQIANTASLDSVESVNTYYASVTDDVIRPGVIVEPNNAGFAVAGGSVTYTHYVQNTGQVDDSYDLTLVSTLGWPVELIDPITGTVIATDTNGDGVWDGGITVNTGTLAPGGTAEYRVRVNVPPGTPLDTAESTSLHAVSNRDSGTTAFATDETTVIDSVGAGPVTLIPDHSGVIMAGGSIAYTHTITNNTGATDTFDLTADPTLPAWTSTFHGDTNGDGVYTPGVDIAISNTLQLADGELQTIFNVVTAPAGAVPGDTDVAHLTAISRNDTDLFDTATDTTTVLPATTHDLSGGGTLLVDQGDTPIFPGTIKNLTGTSDRFDLTITASLFLGLDGLNHPTELWIDTNADGVPDTQIAEDADGDGVWDTVDPAFDTDMDGNPDVAVAGGATLHYELRRPVDPMQLAYRDPVTLGAISQATGEIDSVTATNLLASTTHAVLSDFEVYLAGATVVVEWQTSFEHGTAGFRLGRRATGEPVRALHGGLLPAIGDAPAGGVYRYVDTGAVFGQTYTYVLREVEVDGDVSFLHIREVKVDPERMPADPRGAPPAGGYDYEVQRPFSARSPDEGGGGSGDASDYDGPVTRLRLRISEPELYFVSAQELADGLDIPLADVQDLIDSGGLRLHRGVGSEDLVDPCESDPSAPGEIFSDGFESGNLCAWDRVIGTPPGEVVAWLAADDRSGIYFYGQGIDSIYTDDNIYWLERGVAARMVRVDGGAPPPVSGLSFQETLHFEEEGPYPLTSVIDDPDSDFWFWGSLNVTPGVGVNIDTLTVSVDAPGRAAVAANALMSVSLQAQTSDDDIALDHQVEVRLNGNLIGAGEWDGATAYQLDLSFNQALLNDGDNSVEIRAPAASGIESEIFYLDAIDLSYVRAYQAVHDHLEAAAGTNPVLTIAGFTRDDLVVLDVSDAELPRAIDNLRIDGGAGTYQVSFDAAPGSRVLAMALADALVPALEIDVPSTLHARNNRAEYLVIAGAGLEPAAQRLADYRAGLGLSSMMVRLQDVYDEFSQGVVSPWAIQDFLAHARATWALRPRYVVLAGDSSFDFKDRLGFGGNILPSPMMSTPEGLFPSDHRMTDLVGDDGVPEVGVGRLPVRSNSQLAAYVDKLEAYEAATGPWKDRTLWLADAIDEGGEFIDDTEHLIELVPPGLQVDRIFVDELGRDEARAQLLAAIEDGSLLVHFLGHANLVQLGNDSGLLLSSDVPTLSNMERQPVLTAMTCALGRFDRIVLDTLSESLLLHEGGGTIALWAPTGLSFNLDGMLLSEGFIPSALNGDRLGDAIIRSLAAYLETAEEPLPHVPGLYTLLGDPAIRLQP